MKTLLSIPLLLLVTLVASAAYLADQMLGVVAFTYGYFAFCILTANHLAVFGVSVSLSLPRSPWMSSEFSQ